MTADKKTNVEKARAAWGEVLPDWMLVVAAACDAKGGSQTQVAQLLKVSGALINQALANTYKGRLDKLEQRVRGALMGKKVSCPVAAEITMLKCLEYQRKKDIGTNDMRREFARACPRCPHFMGKTQ